MRFDSTALRLVRELIAHVTEGQHEAEFAAVEERIKDSNDESKAVELLYCFSEWVEYGEVPGKPRSEARAEQQEQIRDVAGARGLSSAAAGGRSSGLVGGTAGQDAGD
jgi:hypothetical protein